jgi:hypothetical protein
MGNLICKPNFDDRGKGRLGWLIVPTAVRERRLRTRVKDRHTTGRYNRDTLSAAVGTGLVSLKT